MGFWNRQENISAAAISVDPTDQKLIKKIKSHAHKNARENWHFFDSLAEVHYPAAFMGGQLSRFDLRIARRVVENGQITFKDDSNPLAWEILAQLDEGDGISELLRLFGVNWTVDADSWLIGQMNGSVSEWSMWSTKEVQLRDTGMEGRVGIFLNDEPLKATDIARRIYKRHPAERLRADSSLAVMNEQCKQLVTLYQAVSATLDSRLASAGILFFPNTLQLAGETSKPTGNGRRVGGNGLIDRITTMMTASMQNHDTAGARIPIMVRGPSGEGDKIVHITLDRLLTETEMKLRNELRDYIAQGLDMPPEVQQGMGDSNHWSDWAIMDSSYRSHVKPVGDAFADAITSTILRPMMRIAGAPEADVRALQVIADGSALIVRPNEGEDALQLRDRGAISEQALRARTGVAETDKPTDEEYIRWVGVKTGDPYLATLGLPAAAKIDWNQIQPRPMGPKEPSTPVRGKVGPGASTAGRPGGGAGGNAGGVKGKSRAAELGPACLVGYRAAFVTVGARLRAQLAQPAFEEQRALVKAVPNEELHVRLSDVVTATMAMQATRGVIEKLMGGVIEPDAVRMLEDQMAADVMAGRESSLTLETAQAIIEMTEEI